MSEEKSPVGLQHWDKLPIVVLPKVSVSALSRHVKHCERKTTSIGEETEDLSKVKIITKKCRFNCESEMEKITFI